MANIAQITRDYVLRARSEGVSGVISDTQKLGQATDQAAVKTETFSRSSVSAAAALERHQRSLDTAYRASRQFEAVQRDLDRAQQQGLVSLQRHNELLGLARQRLGDALPANDNFAKSTRQNTEALKNFGFQANDVFQGLLTGQRPFQILLQQGGQIQQAFSQHSGGAAGVLREFGSSVAGLFTPMRLLAIGVTGIAAAALAASLSWKSFAITLDDTARQAGITSSEMAKLQAAASFKGIGGDDFAKAMSAFSQNVYEAKNNLGPLADIFRANGVQARDFNDAILKGAELIKNAASDQQKLVLLQQMGLPATMQWVRFMSQGADGIRKAREEATQFGGVLNDEMVRRAREFDDIWNRFTTNFGLMWRNAGLGAIQVIVNLFNAITDRVTQFMSNPIVAAYIKFLSASVALGQHLGASVLPAGATSAGIGDRVSGTFDAVNTGYQNSGLQRALDARAQSLRAPGTVDPNVQKAQLGLEQQRISVLGQLATVEEQVRQVTIGVRLARLNGVSITKEEKTALEDLARAQAIGLIAVRASIDAAKIEQATIGMAAGDAAAYRAVWEKVYEARRMGHPLNEQQIRDLQTEAKELGKVIDEAERLRQMRDFGQAFASTLLDAAMNAKSLNDGLKASFDSLAKMASNAAIKNLMEGKFEMAAVDGVVAVGSRLSPAKAAKRNAANDNDEREKSYERGQYHRAA